MANVTMNDVAKEVGVSQATVSFVLNGRQRRDGSVGAETQQLILETAERLGYRVNRTARALATGKSHLIGLCVRQLALSHYANVIGRTEAEIGQSSYHLLVSRWDNAATSRARHLANLFPWPLDGVLALEAGEILRSHWNEFGSWPAPIVSMGGVDYEVPGLDSVGVDLASGVRQAVQHLVGSGCRRIVFAGSAKLIEVAEVRSGAYRAAMEASGKECEFIFLSSMSRAAARDELKNYLAAQNCPDGILCANDETAIGFYRALHDSGLRVGQDVALIGCDGIAETEYLDCPLTTIVQPLDAMCRIAWQMLQERIDNPQLAPRREVLAPQLAIRASSKLSGGEAATKAKGKTRTRANKQ